MRFFSIKYWELLLIDTCSFVCVRPGSPYDGDWLCWGSGLRSYPGISPLTAFLLRSQMGKCKHCGLNFCQTHSLSFTISMATTTTTVVRIWPCCIVTAMTRYTQQNNCHRLVLMTLILVREEPDERENLTSGFEAESSG